MSDKHDPLLRAVSTLLREQKEDFDARYLMLSNDFSVLSAQVARLKEGEKGEQGLQGDRGEKGDLGPVGPIGPTGAQGLKGEKGDTGDQGIQGPQGNQGDKADKGDKGDKGETGEKGDAGNQGTQGEKGDTGSKGDVGEKGDRGEQGESIRGEQGIQGAKGDRGDQGLRGERGERGLEGQQGPKGLEGILPEVYDWVPGQYERTAAVTHRGGTWQAKCRTNEEPGQLGGGEWRCIARGLADVTVEETDQPRLKKIILTLTDGAVVQRSLRIQIPLHMKKWEPDRNYMFNDMAAWGRASYIALRDNLKGVEPGRTEDWAAVAMGGKQGDKGERGERGPLGLPGKPGDPGEQGAKGDTGPQGDPAVLGSFYGPYEAGMNIKRDGIVSHGTSLWLSLVDKPLSPPALQDPSWKRLLSLPIGTTRRVS